jgi:solute carrier family 6 amino acid/orphan transporter-like 15/16/17/18/20
MYILAYLGAMVVCGWPMHILESTLGQKMQRGSAGALRGITPRLAGVGWVASFSGLVISLCYTVLLGLNLYYLMVASGEPWKESNYNRSLSCDTASKATSSTVEIFLFYDVVKILDEKTCLPFEDGYDNYKFNGSLFIGVLFTWILIFGFICNGIKSIRVGTIIVVPFSFLALFICMGHYVGMNNSVEGKGFKYYLTGADEEDPFPFPRPF